MIENILSLFDSDLLLQIASETGVTVVMDCGGVEDPISADLLRNVSVLSPNETELARLTGQLCIPLLQQFFDLPYGKEVARMCLEVWLALTEMCCI